jgi:hypothetical protein
MLRTAHALHAARGKNANARLLCVPSAYHEQNWRGNERNERLGTVRSGIYLRQTAYARALHYMRITR